MIYYFSGTGNTRRVARHLAEALGDRLTAINWRTRALLPTGGDEALGIVFPVYGWGLPNVVSHFVSQLPQLIMGQRPYIYGVMTCGDDVGRTDSLLRHALRRKGLGLDAAYSVQMRNTYVCLPGFDTDSGEVVAAKEAKLSERLDAIVASLRERRNPGRSLLTPGAMPWIKTYVLRPLFNAVLTSDRYFHVDDDRCTGCRLCARTCPLGNIRPDADGKPGWMGHCTHCLACYHCCPHHAVSYGNFTRGKGQVKING